MRKLCSEVVVHISGDKYLLSLERDEDLPLYYVYAFALDGDPFGYDDYVDTFFDARKAWKAYSELCRYPCF